MLPTLVGLDHLVVAVRDLDAAAEAWGALGFTLSPPGLHSAHIGSANYTMMFGEDYLELLGVVTPTPHNQALRDFVAMREGLDRAAFTTTDAAAGAEALRARGVDAVGPVDFGRPVALPDGTETEARFTVFRWPTSARVGGLGIFACQHHTRDAVWVPSLQAHANGVTRIKRLLVASDDPEGSAAGLAAAIEAAVRQEGEFRIVATGAGRGEIAFAPRAAIARLAGCAEDALPREGGAAMVLGTPKPRPTGFATGVAVIFEAP
ncbi:VOC family protein [Roseomonas eburnea]|uniref:VOC family protein n=1 Tax=Neoroseomonas eburnea TaxID=1346889 RepID=A0A9X9X736_9PROT|nr:VOC family protein [Neoroseomonas eburnea]MBR0679522.1 VOC family protein [Neoroseomonas eburnea]